MDLAQRTTINARLHFNSSILFARLRFLFDPVFFHGQPPSQDRIEYLQKAWPLMEGFLADNDYLAGSELSVADLCALATVSSIIEVATIDAQACPRLTTWLKLIAQLPCCQQENLAGARDFQRAFVKVAAKNRAAADKR